MKSFIDAHRTLTTPFDIVVEGQTGNLTPNETEEMLAAWIAAGATWWIEGLWEYSEAQASARIRQGPPQVNTDLLNSFTLRSENTS